MERTAAADLEGIVLHRRVALASGGSVTLSARVDIDTLTLADWRWIWDLEKTLVQYERQHVMAKGEGDGD